MTDDEITGRALLRLAARYRHIARRQSDPVLRSGFARYARECRVIALRACDARIADRNAGCCDPR